MSTISIRDLATEYRTQPHEVAAALDLGDVPDTREIDATYAREVLDLMAALDERGPLSAAGAEDDLTRAGRAYARARAAAEAERLALHDAIRDAARAGVSEAAAARAAGVTRMTVRAALGKR